MTKKAIITPLSNRQNGIDLSTVNGTPQCTFAAMVTTSATGYSAQATHCGSNGLDDPAIEALFVADPTNYQVKDAAGRQPRTWAVVLAECSPPLYPYLGAAP